MIMWEPFSEVCFDFILYRDDIFLVALWYFFGFVFIAFPILIGEGAFPLFPLLLSYVLVWSSFWDIVLIDI